VARRTPQARSKGGRTQNEILAHTVKIASAEGLAGLTIGRLAEELRMSKSGLFAHFRSKQKLELATIDRAWEIFSEEVLLPAGNSREGIERLWRVCDLWLKHIENEVFPGSYFFTGAFFECAGRSGPVPERLTEAVQEWFRGLRDSVRAAQEHDEIDSEADPERITFELLGMLVGAQWHRLLGDGGAFRKARTAIFQLLGGLATEDIPASAFSSLRAWRRFLKKRAR